MFNKLSHILSAKFSKKDDLSRQIEIAKVLDLCRQEIKKIFPDEDINIVSLKNKTLTIHISNSILASELRLREPKIISKVNANMGEEVIRKIIYRF